MGSLVLFLVIVASIVASFMPFSTYQFQDSLLSSSPFSLFRAQAQQDGDNLSEPEDQEGNENQLTENENGAVTTGDSGGSSSMDQAPPIIDGCPADSVLDPTTGVCDSTLIPCHEGETRGESGFCAVMPESCPSGMYIDEDPLCEPCPIEGDIPEECTASGPEPEPQPNGDNTTRPGNTTVVTFNNAIAQAFSSTTYNTNVLQQLAQNTLLVGEETVYLQGMIKANDSRLLSTFDPFRLIGGSAIVYIPTGNASSSLPLTSSSFPEASNSLQLIALDGDAQQYVALPSVEMPVLENSYKTILGEAFQGINPFTGKKVTVDNIKALYLLNQSNQTIALGYGGSVALLTIVR